MAKQTVNGGKRLKPMLPTLSYDIPMGPEWLYEVKYDGFRAILIWEQNGIQLISRNNKDLSKQFPEIIQFLQDQEADLKKYIPFTLDAELVLLDNPYRSNFNLLQTRGRLRSVTKIREEGKKNPARLLVFDLLKWNGKDVTNKSYQIRKERLFTLFKTIKFPTKPTMLTPALVQLVPSNANFKQLWEQVVLHDGEGIVAKQMDSKWVEVRSQDWVKYKNWKYVTCFITAYHKRSGYFHVAVYKNGQVYPIGQFLFGLKPDEKEVLRDTIKRNKEQEDNQYMYIAPAICVELKYLSIMKGQLREAHFHAFKFDLSAQECTYAQFVTQQMSLPSSIQMTSPNKPLWEDNVILKSDYIHYLQTMSSYMLPYLSQRALTVIRYPHGINGEAFFQKNCPDYAPDFIQRATIDGIDYIVCNDLKTLLWLGNQLAIEFHIPFSTIQTDLPSEIVLDLDPPSQKEFPLAVQAALMLKEIFEQLGLVSFVKTSGKKGLQIYLPLPDKRYTYEDTRLFTTFIANYLVSKQPKWFTMERLKKNRSNRLYVDYVQHAEGKTIIAPYSPRGTKHATVSTPLFWEEINEKLSPTDFTITNVHQRVLEKGCPFADFFSVKEEQNFEPVQSFLKKQM